MAGRTYAQVNASLLRSRKFRGLCHKARWAWLCALLKADYAGFAEYPVALWALDAELDGIALQDAISALTKARLIEWSEEQEIARITGFIKQRPPENASSAQRLCIDLSDRLYAADSELEPMLLAASAEFAVAAIGRSLRWKEDSPDRPKLRDSLGQFLRGTAQDFGDEFLEAVDLELKGAGRPTRTEFEGLLPTLSLRRQSTFPTPSPHPVGTRDVDETRRRQDINKYEDENLDGVNCEIREDGWEPIQAETEDRLRKEREVGDSAQVLPMESTKRSALAMGGR